MDMAGAHGGGAGAGADAGAGAGAGKSHAVAAAQGKTEKCAVVKQYVRGAVLGAGTYGVVFRAVDSTTGATVALKKIKLEDKEDGLPGSALREIAVLKLLEHPNIVRLLDVHHSANHLYLVLEFVEQDLRRFMNAVTEQNPLDPRRAMSIVQQLLRGMDYCHGHGVIHRDLKPENILIGPQDDVKIGDFGLARAFTMPTKVYTPGILTLWYRAPEVLLGAPCYSLGVDVWSAGCTFAELFCGHPLWVSGTLQQRGAVHNAHRIGGSSTTSR